MFAHCLQTCFLVVVCCVGWLFLLVFFLFFKPTCSVPLSCCFSVLLLAALTEALSMFYRLFLDKDMPRYFLFASFVHKDS